MSRFPSATHLRIRRGRPWLHAALVEAAHAAVRTKDTYLSAQFRRPAARRGAEKAGVAVAHTTLVIIYHALQHERAYADLGGNYFDERFAGHGPRAGLATSSAAGGVSERAIMNQTGHRSLALVRRYICDGELFGDDNAARGAGL